MNKHLLKLTKALTMYLPMLFCFFTVIDTICMMCGVELNVFNYLGGYSILIVIYLLVNSFTFRYCLYHRIPIYYMCFMMVLNTLEYYFEIFGITYEYVFYFSTGTMIILYSFLKYRDNIKLKNK
jgi:hypothetical protein